MRCGQDLEKRSTSTAARILIHLFTSQIICFECTTKIATSQVKINNNNKQMSKKCAGSVKERRECSKVILTPN
jgi:hypothetical protein